MDIIEEFAMSKFASKAHRDEAILSELERLRAENIALNSEMEEICTKEKTRFAELRAEVAALKAPVWLEPIIRWSLDTHGLSLMHKCMHGDWVLYQHHTAQLAQVQRERDAYKKDAERYRYLRSSERRKCLTKNGPDAGCWIDTEDESHTLILITEEDADAAIDAALTGAGTASDGLPGHNPAKTGETV